MLRREGRSAGIGVTWGVEGDLLSDDAGGFVDEDGHIQDPIDCERRGSEAGDWGEEAFGSLGC